MLNYLRKFLTICLSVALAWSVTARAAEQCGIASWYGPGFHGRLTASGEVFNQYAFTAAHRTLPFGTIVTVHVGNLSVEVRINDRGPFIAGRVIDLSRAAFEVIAPLSAGSVAVCLES